MSERRVDEGGRVDDEDAPAARGSVVVRAGAHGEGGVGGGGVRVRARVSARACGACACVACGRVRPGARVCFVCGWGCVDFCV